MYNVLIVDEEEHLLWALEQNLFPDRNDIAIGTATSGEAGLELLKNDSVDLLISDIKMPGRIDGFQLILRAKEVAPEAKVIIMTAFGTNRIQNFADRIGVTHYVEKPFDTADLRDAILEVLDEREGFQGVLSDLELTDIIQMLCLAKRTALLHLKHRDHRGKIVFENGDVVHSEFDDIEGDDAVYHMLSLRGGDIFMQSDFDNDRKSVTQSWQDLLFEGVKRADEQRALHSEVSEPEDEFPLDENLFGGSELEEESLGGDVTQFGMGVSNSFFSEAELKEIEAAGDAPDFESAPETRPVDTPLPSTALNPDDDDSLIPTTFEANDPMSASFTESPSAEHDPTLFEGVEPEDEEFQSPFRLPDTGVHQSVMSLYDIMSPGTIQQHLEGFSAECPGMKMTAVISPADGLVMNSVQADPETDPEAMAPFFGTIVRSAQSAVDAFAMEKGGDVGNPLEEVQFQLNDCHIIVRMLRPTIQLHVAVVSKQTSLGVALVLMRRFQDTVKLAAEV